MIIRSLENLGSIAVRYLVNDIPARLINGTYNAFSKFYRGQINYGLPVSEALIINLAEIRTVAVSKLASVLYQIYFKATGKQIARDRIKMTIADELEKGRLRLTENVILLKEEELVYLSIKRFGFKKKEMHDIIEVAHRRRIMSEAIMADPVSIYFESEVEESEQNGRGDYETVFYRNFNDEGKEIGFRRIVSMEAVTTGDNQPSVLLIPGFANNSNCFNINDRYSLAKDMADHGCWVYLFDARGVGVNQGRFDPFYTIDTMIDYDLATLVRFIYARSCGKPIVLAGHSMGGIVAENMVLNWSLTQHLDELDMLDEEQKEILSQALPPPGEAQQYLKMVRGVVSLASPKYFNKTSHVFFPTVLWLNHLMRIFRFQRVPVKEVSNALTKLPVLKQITRYLANHNVGDLNFLISPENHKDDKYFIERYLKTATDSIPLGLGFQCIKAIYSGQGFQRMDDSHLNYSECIPWFPENIPVFHFWGTSDNLAPTKNLLYHENYPHHIKKTFYIQSPSDLKKVKISSNPSQVVDIIVEGANHLDLLYGKIADEIVTPLLLQIIEKVWGDWTYENVCSGG